jgi:uncharacterized protein YigE (DUF2233 family)
VKSKTLVACLVVAALSSAAWAVWPAANAYRNTVGSACVKRTYESAIYQICSFDSARHDFRLADVDRHGKALRNFAGLARQLGPASKNIVFAMNAGMFDSAGLPIGLYIENGKSRAPLNRHDASGNFYLKPNGVFWIDEAGTHIDTTDDFAAKTTAHPIWASQSGPMLVIDGALNPKFSAEGSSRHVRNGVCVKDTSGASFVISDTAIPLSKFARFLRDDLQCTDALYLDGEISSLWDGASGRNDQKHPLGPMLVVSARRGG